jgi:hypothetical protein
VATGVRTWTQSTDSAARSSPEVGVRGRVPRRPALAGDRPVNVGHRSEFRAGVSGRPRRRRLAAEPTARRLQRRASTRGPETVAVGTGRASGTGRTGGTGRRARPTGPEPRLSDGGVRRCDTGGPQDTTRRRRNASRREVAGNNRVKRDTLTDSQIERGDRRARPTPGGHTSVGSVRRASGWLTLAVRRRVRIDVETGRAGCAAPAEPVSFFTPRSYWLIVTAS